MGIIQKYILDNTAQQLVAEKWETNEWSITITQAFWKNSFRFTEQNGTQEELTIGLGLPELSGTPRTLGRGKELQNKAESSPGIFCWVYWMIYANEKETKIKEMTTQKGRRK